MASPDPKSASLAPAPPASISSPTDGSFDVPKPLTVTGSVTGGCTTPQIRITYTVGGVSQPPVTSDLSPGGDGSFTHPDDTPAGATDAFIEILCDGEPQVDASVEFA